MLADAAVVVCLALKIEVTMLVALSKMQKDGSVIYPSHSL